MTKQRLFGATLATVLAAGIVLLAANPAPTVPFVPSEDIAISTQPFVVKLHARWCPSCMVTKDVWSVVQQAYAGRVRLVVFDFTTDETTAASLADARRLGLDAVFEAYSGVTGTVLILDGRSKEVRADLGGTRDVAAYKSAIDAVLSTTPN